MSLKHAAFDSFGLIDQGTWGVDVFIVIQRNFFKELWIIFHMVVSFRVLDLEGVSFFDVEVVLLVVAEEIALCV